MDLSESDLIPSLYFLPGQHKRLLFGFALPPSERAHVRTVLSPWVHCLDSRQLSFVSLGRHLPLNLPYAQVL